MRTWSRKETLENVNVGKHATINSTVRNVERGTIKAFHVDAATGKRVRVPYNARGKVLESGTGSRRAKDALGTTAAFKVEWDMATITPCAHVDANSECAYCNAHPEQYARDVK